MSVMIADVWIYLSQFLTDNYIGKLSQLNKWFYNLFNDDYWHMRCKLIGIHTKNNTWKYSYQVSDYHIAKFYNGYYNYVLLKNHVLYTDAFNGKTFREIMCRGSIRKFSLFTRGVVAIYEYTSIIFHTKSKVYAIQGDCIDLLIKIPHTIKNFRIFLKYIIILSGDNQLYIYNFNNNKYRVHDVNPINNLNHVVYMDGYILIFNEIVTHSFKFACDF